MIILSLMCVLFISRAYGGEGSQDNVDLIIPPGMETIKEGDVNLVVYKGSRLRKEGDVIIPEPPGEYVSRKFVETDDRFKKVEKELEAQKNELEAQKKELGDLKSAVKKPEDDGRKK
ncbi:MAG: hypothetical protein NTY34_07140 [Candidatus Omnitrophica bacterium]|nr:hypothetical protein [Candidatus Omnitrophota bacterium]